MTSPFFELAQEIAERERIEALRKKNLKPDGLTVLSPCPGFGIGTPWGKKPNDNTYWQARGHHTGDDYPGNYGDDEVSVLSGVCHLRWDSVLGNCVLLYASNGFTYWYCHMSKRSVKEGQKVNKNQKLGEVGQSGSGAKFGPHLHFEKRKGHTMSWAGKDLKPIW